MSARCRLLLIVGVWFASLLLVSCWGEPDYPPQLVEADSLLMRSDYEHADSLLKTYTPRRGEKYAVNMYRQLLDISLQYKQHSQTVDFAQIDSLERFYRDFGTPDKHAKALSLLGYFYYKNQDYPAAMDSYMASLTEAKAHHDVRLMTWLYRQIGDVYYYQAMYRECIEPYQLYFQCAEQTGDNRQQALAANKMGVVKTYFSEVDSAIYFYQRSIDLGQHQPYADEIVPFSRYALADIYIQIEEFDSAMMFMSRDTMNLDNWGYWHLGLGHTDSARYYFRQAIEPSKNQPFALRNIYQQLAQIDLSTQNHDAALEDYIKLAEVEDSIKKQSRETETRLASTRHGYQQLKQERDDLARRSWMAVGLSVALFFLIVLLSGWAMTFWRSRQKEHQEALTHEQLLRQEEERKQSLSQQQLEANQRTIEQLNQQLSENKDQQQAARLRLEAQLLEAQNKVIAASQQRQQLLRNDLEQSNLLSRIKLNAGKERFHLSDEEWQQLGKHIDQAYDGFTQRLLNLAKLSELEMQVCYLTKIEVQPTAIATMLFKTKAAISMMRNRMYVKLTRRPGSSPDFEEFIRNF